MALPGTVVVSFSPEGYVGGPSGLSPLAVKWEAEESRTFVSGGQ